MMIPIILLVLSPPCFFYNLFEQVEQRKGYDYITIYIYTY